MPLNFMKKKLKDSKKNVIQPLPSVQKKYRYKFGLSFIPEAPIVAEERKMRAALKPHGETRVMRTWNEYYDVTTTWRHVTPTIWSCVKAEKPLDWMVGKSHLDVKNELIRRGFNWEWK